MYIHIDKIQLAHLAISKTPVCAAPARTLPAFESVPTYNPLASNFSRPRCAFNIGTRTHRGACFGQHPGRNQMI